MRWQEGGVGTVGLGDARVGVVGAGCGNARVESRVKTAETGLHGHKPVGLRRLSYSYQFLFGLGFSFY